jgi:hypothetical protein
MLLAAGCGVTPLTGKLVPGDDPFVIVVGEGADGATDLFAAPAVGGPFTRLTFTRPAEELPRIAPEGRRVGFIRRYDAEAAELVVLSLETMGEIRVALPAPLRHPVHLGWFPSGDTVVVADSSGFYFAALATRPVSLQPAPAGLASRADSVSREWLGDPPFASIRPCRAAAGYCAVAGPAGGQAGGRTGGEDVETALGSQVRDPIRWGAAAVAYVRDGRIEVRPLGGGSASHPEWSGVPEHLRQPTHHAGRVAVPPA